MVMKMYYKKVAGERVYLSPMGLDDLEVYTKWINAPEVTDNIGISHFNNSFTATKEWLENKLKDSRCYYLAIVNIADDNIIGCVEFVEIDHIHRTATLAIFIGDSENRGNGFGTEAMNLALKYGFDALNLNNIGLNVYSFNERAYRSYIKCGFKEYGRRRSAYYLNGEYHDIICMDILNDEWHRNREK